MFLWWAQGDCLAPVRVRPANTRLEGQIIDTVGSLLVWFFAGTLLLATVLPLSKRPLGLLRGLEFLRQQFFAVAMFLCVFLMVFNPDWLGGYGVVVIALLGGAQLIYIAKFSPVWWRQSVDATDALKADSGRLVSVLAANVKKSNREYGQLVQMVQAQRPDIVLAIEVDQPWINALKHNFEGVYDHWIDVPKDNGYGISVLSKLPLEDADVRDLVTQDVPSVRVAVRLRNGKVFRLYVVHPEPPTILHDTKGRDSEIALIGLEAAKDVLPAIVAGDLNDVAWSTTTRRFQRLSGLLDPRVGRGFYNTFSATMPWMRWPLDHLFHDPAFRLVEMARLGKIGSDHFPMWFVLALADTKAEETSPGEHDPAEAHAAKRMIVQERKRPREPIGSDWEDE